MFPIWSSKIKFADHALFYKKWFNLQEQAKFDADNTPYLYHRFKHCLKLGQSLADCNSTITSGHNQKNMILGTYSDNIDHLI
jgi:hypothetical protein